MKNKGFTLIEIIIAVGLAALILPALIIVFSLSIKSAGQGENFTQAYAIAQKDMESVYNLKESWDWSNPSVPLPDAVNGYTQKIEVFNVKRCGIDICEDGVEDEFTKRIVVTVQSENGQDVPVIVESYVTQH